MTNKDVKEYYEERIEEEWRRLTQDPYHGLEFLTTIRFLHKFLPKKGRILDAGGGPGRYSLHLAKQGYDIVLLDLAPGNLTFAKLQFRRAKVVRKLAKEIEGTVSDLSDFPDNSFDAVMCLGGPLSHIIDRRQRAKAISELVRVNKPGAPLFVSVMGLLSILAVELTQYPVEIEKPFFKILRDTGDYRGGSGFTACHFFLPEELERAFTRSGVSVKAMIGLEGVGSHHAKEINDLAKHKRRWKIWLETHHRTCEHPSVVGISEHMLLIGTKQGGRA